MCRLRYLHTNSCYPITVNYAKVINSGYSHISEPTQELNSRAAPSVGGSITAQLVQPQGEIPEEGRKRDELWSNSERNLYHLNRMWIFSIFNSNTIILTVHTSYYSVKTNSVLFVWSPKVELNKNSKKLFSKTRVPFKKRLPKLIFDLPLHMPIN